MSRTTARKHAFPLVFQLEFHKGTAYEKLVDTYFDNHTLEEEDKDFIYKEFSGTCQNLEQIDSLIRDKLKGWKMDRLNKVDIALMRLAVYEILFAEDIPPSVSVNEAVEIAKNYSVDDATGFINGVLGSIVKQIEENKG